MAKKFIFFVLFTLTSSAIALAQNSNSSTTTPARPRTSVNSNQQAKPPAPKPTSTAKPAVTTSAPKSAAKKPVVKTEPPSGSDGVLAAFNGLLDGIRKADVDAVTTVYWNSPRLSLFNYNGSVKRAGNKFVRIARALILRSKT